MVVSLAKTRRFIDVDIGQMTQPTIQPYQTLDQLQQALARAFCDLAERCISERGVLSVSLSGGSTPKRLYELLTEFDLPWRRIHWFWGDDRDVPHDHVDSNFRMFSQAFLRHVPTPAENIHPVPIHGQQPIEVAREYEAELRSFFRDQAFPSWDLVLLGMGDDAHTASLFPETGALEESERWFVENWVEKLSTYRYTLTPPAINSGRQIWFMVSGPAKRHALASLLGEDRDPRRFPAQLVSPTRWFVTNDVIT